MTTASFDLNQAFSISDPISSVSEIKRIVASSLVQADRSARIVPTENFNHSYLPDFVIEWSRTDRRFVYLRPSMFAEEIAEDVVTLADRSPIFLHLGELQSYNPNSTTSIVDNLDEEATEARTLVTSVPAMNEFSSPEAKATGQLLSSFVMRGGRGLIEDQEASAASASVESGFNGALSSDGEQTSLALRAVDAILDVSTATRFKRFLEVAWISSGASPLDFPGGVASIGDAIPAALLQQLLAVVPATSTQFWTQLGGSIDMRSFEGLSLVGDQPQMQFFMQTALPKLYAKKCTVRRTERFSNKADPFLWQLENGVVSLRGGGYQAWLSGASAVRAVADRTLEIEARPTYSNLSTRAANAAVTLTAIDMASDLFSVRFASMGGADISSVVDDSDFNVDGSATANEAVALVEGKSLEIRFEDAVATLRTSAIASASGLIWASWSLLTSRVDEEVREGLLDILHIQEVQEDTVEDDDADDDDADDDDEVIEYEQDDEGNWYEVHENDFDEDAADEERWEKREEE